MARDRHGLAADRPRLDSTVRHQATQDNDGSPRHCRRDRPTFPESKRRTSARWSRSKPDRWLPSRADAPVPPRDVTPEATLAVAHGAARFGELQMRQVSPNTSHGDPVAAGRRHPRHRCLIVNLPGHEAIKDTLEASFLPHRPHRRSHRDPRGEVQGVPAESTGASRVATQWRTARSAEPFRLKGDHLASAIDQRAAPRHAAAALADA